MTALKEVIGLWFFVNRKKQILAANDERRTTSQLGFTLINRGTIKARHSGFTLIELMIAITIVAIISTIGIISFSQTQKLARDTRRKLDLRSIAIALELYYQKNKTYPVSDPVCNDGGGPWCASSGSNPWIPPLNTNYMNQLPKDPRSNTTNPWTIPGGGYAYYGGPCVATSAYILITSLENANDQDAATNKHYKWCDQTTELSGWWGGQIFAISSWQ